MEIKFNSWIPKFNGDTISGKVFNSINGRIYIKNNSEFILIGFCESLIDFSNIISKGNNIKITYLGGKGKSSLYRCEIVEDNKLDFSDVNKTVNSLYGL